MENEIINALLTRRSVRSYKPQQVTDDELRTVLETGTYAPTSMGRGVASSNLVIPTEVKRY